MLLAPAKTGRQRHRRPTLKTNQETQKTNHAHKNTMIKLKNVRLFDKKRCDLDHPHVKGNQNFYDRVDRDNNIDIYDQKVLEFFFTTAMIEAWAHTKTFLNHWLTNYGGTPMKFNTNTDVVYRDIDSSPTLTQTIHKKIEKLYRYSDSIIHSRVVLDVPHHNKHKGNMVRASIELGVKGAPITVSHNDPSPHVAVRDAFAAVERKLKKETAKLKEH